jgi:TadE-like protein
MTTTVQSLIRPLRHLTDGAQRGQALVEFSLAVIPFLILLMGVVDLGRGIYTMNGTSEAARDITRVTIVHLADSSGNVGQSSETADVIQVQKALIPGLEIDPSVDIDCVDEYDAIVADDECRPGSDFVRVHVEAPFAPITPIVSMFGSHTFESTSRMQIP